MVKQTILKLGIPILFLASIYSGIYYNFAIWYNYSTFESYFSFFVASSTFTNGIAIAFIIFMILLVVSINFINKIVIKPIMTFFVVLIGFCCVYISFTFRLEWFNLYFILMGISVAYLTPCLIKLTSDILRERTERTLSRQAFAVISIIWIIVSASLFGALGTYYPASSWRILYLVTGIINIASSPLISLL
ncbi:MAG: hypothetical protein ACFFDB_03800 [Promethearchaeota archaeon]